MLRHLSIRAVLGLLIAPLGVLLLLGSADSLWRAWRAHEAAARVAILAEMGESLFHALAAGRLERGALTAALGNPAPIVEADLPRIVDNRALAERGQQRALDTLAAAGLPGLSEHVVRLRERHAALTQMRQRADAALRQPRAARDAETMAGVPRAFDAWLEMAAALADQVDAGITMADARVDQLVALKRAAWALRLYAGMEALRVNTAVSAGRPFTDADGIAAAVERGRARQAWSVLLEAEARPDARPAFRAAMGETERRYLAYADGALRQRIELLSTGRMPEITITALQAENGAALGAIVDLANAVLGQLVGHAREARGAAGAMLAVHGAAALLALVLTLVGLMAAERRISGPIRAMTAAMRRVARREFDAAIPGAGRGDEIGEMAAAVQVFRTGLIEADRMAEAERQAQQEALRRAAELQALAKDFEARIAELTALLASSAGQLEDNAGAMNDVAGRGTQQAGTIATAAQGADQAVQTVAAATEQLAASIAEITRQVTHSQGVVQGAVAAAERTDRVVQALSEGAGRISQVVALIHGIAGQTNLLALNATIEAARAGDAGKGFAVVAGEVKALAAQTARATDEIGGQIGQIQAATQDAVAAIRGIAHTVGEVSDITASIVGAIRQQDAATREISASVQRVAAGNREVADSIGAIGGLAEDTRRAASGVLAASGDLSRQTAATRQEVGRFLDAVRAA